MTIIAVGGMASRSSDWLFVTVVLAVAYIVLYPIYVFYLRNQHARRIKRQLVTSEYKLPHKLNPTELAYVFSASVKQRHLYATLLDLANRSVVVLKNIDGKIYVEPGPKIDDSITPSESLLVDNVHESNHPILVTSLLTGHTIHHAKGQKVSGSKHYVFWWLLREQLRSKKVIQKYMIGNYTKLLFGFGACASLCISIVSLSSWRFVEMLQSGEVDFSLLVDHAMNALSIWGILLVPLLLISFFLLRLRGKLLGRHWLLTKSYRRYLNQLIAFKEYIRMTNKHILRYESKELEKETTLRTKPYAIALGYSRDMPRK